MPKYEGKQVSPKWVKSNRRREREMKKKNSENNGQLCFDPPPQVEHASRLDQLLHLINLGYN